MRVSGSEFRTGGASTSTSICTGGMARYIPNGLMLVRTGTDITIVSSSSLRIKIPTHMRKQLKINVFSYFNLVRNFKFTTSLHSSALVGVVECDYLLSILDPNFTQPDMFSSMLNRDEINCSNLSSVS